MPIMADYSAITYLLSFKKLLIQLGELVLWILIQRKFFKVSITKNVTTDLLS